MSVQAVIFLLGNEEYGIPIETVREITTLGSVRAVPQAPEYVIGIINLRGQAIPLIDLYARFGISKGAADKIREEGKADQEDYALIIEVHGNIVGFVVDQVREVRILDQISPPPALITSPFIGGIVNLPERIIMLLTPEQILEQEEFNSLTQMALQ